MVQYTFKSLKEDKLSEINAISLILDDTKVLENGLHCPTLKLLQVSTKGKKPLSWPELFFQGMSALKVLSLQNLCIPKLPYLSQASLNLHTLQVEHCDVGDISIIGKELKHLEVLSFADSNIKELPFEIGNLGSLRLLDLSNCNDLVIISDNVLIRLSRLEEIYFRMDNFPWKKNEASLNELKKISHQLKVVEMKVGGAEILVKDLVFNNLQKFWIYVDLYSDFQHSAYLESNLLQVKSLKNVLTQLSADCPIPYLKDLRVDSCPDLQHLIDCSVRCNDFPQIHSLSFKKLQNLKEMCYTPNNHEVKGMIIDFSYFVKLELIDLPSCIGFNNAMNFKELNQKLEVKSCALIENIIEWSRDEEDENKGHVATISFNKLDCVSLSSLPKLVSICSDSLWLECPSLKQFDIEDCPILEMYFLPTNIDAKHDNLNNVKDVGFQSFQENNSRSSSWSSRNDT
uniref:Leucine-rich repeat n=1 Tax=Medicago truncatula TaxID=3880 RepID=A2Q1Z6_MEDTR|nr:Leucine-rich repeat [Medicago truncatula]